MFRESPEGLNLSGKAILEHQWTVKHDTAKNFNFFKNSYFENNVILGHFGAYLYHYFPALSCEHSKECISVSLKYFLTGESALKRWDITLCDWTFFHIDRNSSSSRSRTPRYVILCKMYGFGSEGTFWRKNRWNETYIVGCFPNSQKWRKTLYFSFVGQK